MKIGICGRMAAGKTTLAEFLKVDLEAQVGYSPSVIVLSLAGKVKEIAYDLFKMDPSQKDRPLLQQIGMKMREIRENVWLDYILDLANEYERKGFIVIVDDVRFVNEAVSMKNEGWEMIRIDVDEDTQLERLKKTYADWDVHWENRNNPSERQVDEIPDDVFTYIIDAKDVKQFRLLEARV